MTTTQIVLSVLTVTLSGVVAAITAHRLGTRREENALRRQKLEQLYMAYTGFCTQLISTYSPILAVMKGEISYNDALDIQIGDGRRKQERHYETIRMLVDLYFSHLTECVGVLDTVRARLTGIEGEFRGRYKAGRFDGSEFIESFTATLLAVDDLGSHFAKVAQRETDRLLRRGT